MSVTTRTYPYDTIVEVTDEIGGEGFQASGVLIAPDEVLTASHVVYQAGVGTATDIEVSPGYEDGATPFGTVAGVSYHYNAIDDSDDAITLSASQSDYAVIHLATPLTSLGTMGIEAGFAGGQATVSGYPASAGGAQVDTTESFTKNPQYTLLDGRPLGDGSSGGPVWVLGPSGTPEIVGLVSSGSGNQGYFVQITVADEAQIESWVAGDDGTGSPAPTAGTETVTGAGGAIVTLTLPAATAPLASVLLGQLTADIAAAAVVAENATPGIAVPALPGAAVGELVVSQSQSVAVPAAYKAVIDTAAGASTISLVADMNDTVVASGGPLTLVTGATSGTLAGGSGGTLFVGGTSAGSWDVALAGGANTVAAAAGAATISAGAGQNLIFLGTGASSVASTGTDTIVGGTGASTVSAGAGPDLVFAAAAPLTFVAGTSASTIVGGANGTTVDGGTGATLYFGNLASVYQGAGAADTIVGGTGPLNGNAGGGAVLMFGGTGGNNRLSSGGGAATLVGGGAGDVLTATGSGNAVLAAAAGAETLNAAASSGAVLMFAGGGNDLIEAGRGNDTLVAGPGNDTLAAGSIPDLFVFANGAGGGTDIITNFAAGRDYLSLSGFAVGAAAAAVRAETVGASGTQIVLPDGTHITFAGVSGLSLSSFV